MKALISIVILMACSLVYGQSAKKLNKQLWAELTAEERKQDSAYAVFSQTKIEYDSVRKIFMNKILVISQDESSVRRLDEDFRKMSNQLRELGVNPGFVAEPMVKNDGIPNHKELVAPLKDAFRIDATFNRVSHSFPFDKNSKLKEQNPFLQEKLEVYRDHSKMNAVQQDRLERSSKLLAGFFPKLDSLSRVYELMANELRAKGGKLSDKLYELRSNYIAKGPHGFPEGYKKVFYDAFPPPLAESLEEALKNNHTEGMEFDEIGPAPVEPAPEIYEYADEMAVFPGGPDKMRKFISDNLRYPEGFKEVGGEGRIVLKFVVSEKGEISDIRIIKSDIDCQGCDQEAIRMVKLMPNWVPARQNGRTVKSYGKLTVWFKL